jgi:3-oxoadipate enol-lactonase
MPFVTTNGVKLHYTEAGAGPECIVFSHGVLWSGEMYAAQVEALKGRYRCIAYDHRGQGQSEVTADGYDMDNVARDAAGLIEALSASPCHFVGLSMGGFVGMRLAARQPYLIRSLTLLNTAADPEPGARKELRRIMGYLSRVVGFRPFLGEATKALFGRPFLEDPARKPQLQELRERLAANRPAGASRALFGVIDRQGIEGELAKIKAPTQVVTGEFDVSVVPARSQRTAQQIPGAEFKTVPRAGHSSTMEEPEAINAVLKAFLERVAARTS